MDFRRRTKNAPSKRRPLTPAGGPSLRLAAMLVGLLLVITAMARLDEPATQQALARAVGAGQVAEAAEPGPALVERALLREVTDNAPFRSSEQPAWFATLRAVRDAAALRGPAVGYVALNTQPDAYRGRAVSVAGRVMRVEQVAPAENDDGFESLWRVTLAPAGGEVWPITVYTIQAPPPAEPPYDTVVTGVFFKKLSYRWAEGVGSTPVVVARRLGDEAREPPGSDAPEPLTADRETTSDRETEPEADFDPPPKGSLGRALLEDLGVELERLDTLVDKQALGADEADAFYAVLGAVRETPAAQLARLAAAGLPNWAERNAVAVDTTLQAAQVAREVEKAFDKDRYAVAPFFLQPQRQRGELVAFDAVLRRVVRVDAAGSRVAADEGVDFYYEGEAFTDDSQNLPVVFCFLELPEGLVVGEKLEQPVRLPGFLLKQWAYRIRRPSDTQPGDRRQFAPLLIGRAPILLATPEAASTRPGLWIGLAGSACLLAVVAALWKQGRADRRYEVSTLARYRARESVFDAERLAELSRESSGQ